MKNVEKYAKGYFMPPEPCYDWAKKDAITHAPIWCSVDLRDGNQALIIPMSLEQKLEFFQYLVQIGFKEIEVGFPAASETEFEFLRALIDRNLIPEDVTVQVLTQSREHIIKKTFEALSGVKQAIVHLYNSTSVAQREQVFKKPKEEIIDIAVTGARLVQEYAAKTPGHFRFEYSPESFTGTEMEFALEISNRVLEIWQPTPSTPVIINLPSTMQLSMPHVYASQVEYISKHLKYRENVILSVHPHNDRGCGIADAEMGMLAGAQRVEGTLFGNGERTGNTDVVTIALNMFAQGVDPQLSLENLPQAAEIYERVTGLSIPPRQPYAGELVFTAFSGSHQDAIAKGMHWRQDHNCPHWNVPYLMIDPKDIGRNYEGDIIRINSQSGKGGIGYLMEQKFGYNLPPKIREAFGYAVKSVSDHAHKELQPEEVFAVFEENYLNIESPVRLLSYKFDAILGENGVNSTLFLTKTGSKIEEIKIESTGNGRLDAVSNGIKATFGLDYEDFVYSEHALSQGSTSLAAAYVGFMQGGKLRWAVSTDHDIMTASVKALIGAVNQALKA